MKKLNLILIVAIFLLSLTGCLSYGTQFYKSYIEEVVNADSVRFEAKGSLITSYFTNKKPGMSKKERDDFRKSYGDWSYDRENTPNPGRDVVENRFSSIEIVSDSDFNNFKAGESLRSVTKLIAGSPHTYIKSGYKKWFDWENSGYSDVTNGIRHPELHPVIKTLDKITADDMILLNPLVRFEFTEVPTIKKHNFTITFIEGDNRFSNTLQVDFSE